MADQNVNEKLSSHLPQPARPVGLGPGRPLGAPVDQLDDELRVEDDVGQQEGRGQRVDLRAEGDVT